MKSSNRSEPLDLDRDLPTTQADVLALRRAKALTPPLDLDDYLRFLAQLPPPAVVRARPAPRAFPIFELPS
jgi:hypothetical protein